MSGILEVYLWLVIGKNISNNSGNRHIVGSDQIMMSTSQVLLLAQQPCSEHFPTLNEVLGPVV